MSDSNARQSKVSGIGGLIEQMRMQRGISAVDLAKRSGIHRNTLYRIESGEHEPSLTSLVRIGEILNVDGWELLRRSTRCTQKGAFPCSSEERGA